MKQNKTGFTLAEVLITLGILGVVAALTMPSLVTNHQKKVTVTRLQRFYSSMNQAITLSAGHMGIVDLSGFPFAQADTSESIESWFKEYLQPYLNTLDISASAVYFPDGSVVELVYYGHDFNYYIDAKKYQNNTAVNGKDRFQFAFYPDNSGYETQEFQDMLDQLGRDPLPEIFARMRNNGMVPYIGSTWDGTREHLPQVGGHAYLIQENGWEIPDDYPIKF